jgi:hypothetical protein
MNRIPTPLGAALTITALFATHHTGRERQRRGPTRPDAVRTWNSPT